MSVSLEVRALTRRHPGSARPALDSLDVAVPAGACLALLGPSGSGKTTALRLIAGLDKPDSGAVLVGGVDLAGVPPERRGMAMLAQRPLLFGHLDVAGNVAFAAVVAGQPRWRARADALEQLARVGLDGFGDRRTGELSGGQAQRVALARALTSAPGLLLLDEPTTGLDSAARAEVHELLRAVRRVTGTTTVLVTHDPAEAAALADGAQDRVAVLAGGRLEQHDELTALYTRPASLTVARLLGGRTEVAGTVVAGRHRSALGSLPVQVGTADGPGVLVLRPELVALGPVDDGVPGTVTGVRGLGARWLVSVEVAPRSTDGPGPARVDAEVGPDARPAPGDRVGLVLPAGPFAVVPPELTPG